MIKKMIRSFMVFLAFTLLGFSTTALANVPDWFQIDPKTVEGPWSGVLSTDGPSGEFGLTITRQGSDWRVKIRLILGGNEISNEARDVVINGNDISFKADIFGAEAQFTGRLDRGDLSGRMQASQNGQVVGMGNWNLKPGAAEPVTPPKPHTIDVKSPMIIDYLTVSSTHIAFAFNGDIWRVKHRGGKAQQLTSTSETEDYPMFSPDGQWLAFSRVAGGNMDVYVKPTAGGETKRLTYYPKLDYPIGWTPDSEEILFYSGRDGDALNKLFTVSRDGAFPSRLPLPKAFQGSFSPDGNRLAYLPRPTTMNVNRWRYYRGGLTSPLWIVDFDDLEVQEVTDETFNVRFPMWVDDRIYYVSDQTGTFNLNVYDTRSDTHRPLTAFKSYGIEYADASGDMIAFFRNGTIHLYNATNDQVSTVPVTLTVEAPDRQERSVRAQNWIQSASITANGHRVLFGARGDALLFDPSNSQVQNTTRTASVAERYPVMSPSGRWIAYMSDASGEYELHLRPTGSEDDIKTFSLEEHPSFYRELTWSPDGRFLAYSDARLALWMIDVESGETHKVDESTYIAQNEYHPNWSPDSRWITYAKALDTRLRAAFLYDTATRQTHQITDGLTHVEYPVFDRNGLYLYFISSTNARRAAASDIGWGLLSTMYARPLTTRTVHMSILRNNISVPMLPNGKAHPNALPAHVSHIVQIDLEGLNQRIITLPLRPADYTGLKAGPPGVLYVNKTTWPETPGNFGPTKTPLFKLDLGNPRQLEPLVENISEYSVSYDGRNILYRFRNNWTLADADSLLESKAEPLNTAEMKIDVYPIQEWTQMYYEAWRKMRDYFYDPNHHGQDLAALEDHYAAHLPNISSRTQLNQLFNKMLGNISVSHMSIGGGDSQPRRTGQAERVGVIGADFEIDQGKYRFVKVLRSGHFSSSNPLWKAPLDQPGTRVKEGEYLLAVDGVTVTDSINVYMLFEGKVNTPVELTVATDHAGTSSRTITVVPLLGVGSLRLQNWAMENEKKVEELSGGRLGYIYVPGYGGSGLEAFYRGLMGMTDKEGLIIDQRYNGGGITSDVLIEALNRQPLYYYAYRHGKAFPTPPVTFSGPKVLIINEGNFSAAETFAMMFKLEDVGTIVGKRTGGGGIGTALFQYPLVDGGRLRIPNRAGYNPAGTWDIENYGITPHIEVDILPKDWDAGRDPQLEKAVETGLRGLGATGEVKQIQPVYPVHP